MTELPAGTLTFVFSDVEGSTRLLRHLGERYAPVAWARRSLREVIRALESGEQRELPP